MVFWLIFDSSSKCLNSKFSIDPKWEYKRKESEKKPVNNNNHIKSIQPFYILDTIEVCYWRKLQSWQRAEILTTIYDEHQNNIVQNANRKKFLNFNDMALHFSEFSFAFRSLPYSFFMPICNLVENTNNLCSTMTKERMCNVKQTMANDTRWAHMFAVFPGNVHVHLNHVSFEWANNTDFLFLNTAAFLCHII